MSARRIRHLAVTTAIATAMGAGCDLGELREPPEHWHLSRPIVGGAPTPDFPAVGFLTTTTGQCTGTLVSPRVVLTAAHCIHDSIVSNQIAGTMAFGESTESFIENRSVTGLFAHRFYDPNVVRTYDIGLVRLDQPPTLVNPMPFNLLEIDDSFIGAPVQVVGFGVTDGEAQVGAGTKRQVGVTIDVVTSEHVGLGDELRNICQGDSGGPTFLDMGGVQTVIAVSSFGSNFCRDRSFVTRTDVFQDDFLLEVIAAWDGPCPQDGSCVTSGCGEFPDPDCDQCLFDGRCAAGCDEADLDCPRGLLPGEFCDKNDDCESRRCVEALDDSRVKYCSQRCGSGQSGCQAPLSQCLASGGEQLCFFSGTTPSSQGSACSAGGDCRSGVCHPDDDVCVEECGDGFPTCSEPFVCEKFANSRACVFESGGCGCRATSRGAKGVAAFAMLAWLACAVRRRRRRLA